MKAAVGRRVIKMVSRLVDFVLLVVILLLLGFAFYALWDAEQLYRAADHLRYAAYKPAAADEGKSFQELQALNAEVFAWLTVYGTNIDYPVAQGEDNMKYVNTNAEGLRALSGSIFLDCGNSNDFTDFNSILYGHHMEKKAMFGPIGDFLGKEMFNTHRYGNLYFGGKNHGLEFFAFLHADAYDHAIFTADIEGETERQALLDDLLARAIHKRDIDVTTGDHIVLLSTCSSGSTNGRDVLVGKITGETYEDPFTQK